MKVEQIAANYRKKNGNETRKSYIKPGHIGFTGITAGDVREEVIRQSELSEQRKERRERKSVREWIKSIWVQKLDEIAYRLPDQGYSMGGERVVHLKDRFGNILAKGYYEDMKEYASSSRYRATHSYYEAEVSLSDLHRYKHIAGVVTFVESDDKIAKAEWFESKGSKQHFKLNRVSGFITKDYHADSYEEAQEWRSWWAKHLWNQRKKRREDAQRERKVAEAKQKAKKMFYGLDHARKAGLCRTGIERFASDYNLDTEFGYRGDVLLAIAERNGRLSYVKRMISNRANQIIK